MQEGRESQEKTANKNEVRDATHVIHVKVATQKRVKLESLYLPPVETRARRAQVCVKEVKLRETRSGIKGGGSGFKVGAERW